ncbi:uncharacterized protein CLUP02_15066 [Colletotrichum lupini]|uniref:Uncharacterized protein n=1 Tax=Colletotrichum lupini TaxID=145971 RepID=A0A9Q8T5T1_9PEZI|nr:uncharacterized protein CLUP02_15066 [Colletotrichum lupini]UQC89535.1 hypothetical protein CLUP02_15066 [Colletotrichum lupini]
MGNGSNNKAKQQGINKPKTIGPDNELGFQVLPVIITTVKSQHVTMNEYSKVKKGSFSRGPEMLKLPTPGKGKYATLKLYNASRL